MLTHDDVKKIVIAVLEAEKQNAKPFYKDWRFIVGSIMGIPTFLIAVGTVWLALGFPTVASSNDIKRIERGQAELAVSTYQNIINSLVANTPADNAPPQQREAWREQMEQAKRQRDRAVEQKIDLSK